MASVFDVGQYILSNRGPMSAMKLQKLVYYSQAWSTVWDDDCLFEEKVRAWLNGPVVRELWEAHQGRFKVDAIAAGKPEALSEGQQETVNRVLAFYGERDAQWLSDLTHMEDPWKNAWAQGKNSEITPEAMSEYYSSIAPPAGE